MHFADLNILYLHKIITCFLSNWWLLSSIKKHCTVYDYSNHCTLSNYWKCIHVRFNIYPIDISPKPNTHVLRSEMLLPVVTVSGDELEVRLCDVSGDGTDVLQLSQENAR